MSKHVCLHSPNWYRNANAKKYESAAMTLKDMITTLLSDISCVRDNCVSHESVLNDIIVDVREKLRDSTASIAALQASEARHKKEVLRLTYDNDAMKVSQKKLEDQCELLRSDVREMTTKLAKAEEQLKSEERLRTKAESVASSLEHEMSYSRSAATQSISEVKEEYNQRIEQSISGYKSEIALLRGEIDRKQHELGKYSNDRIDMEKRSMELQQEIFRIQSLQREAENARDRLEREVERLTNDLNSLREQSLQKDADLRTTLMSLTDLQRQSSEEKAGLRAEIRYDDVCTLLLTRLSS
jgi:chromosome segregation ATPase